MGLVLLLRLIAAVPVLERPDCGQITPVPPQILSNIGWREVPAVAPGRVVSVVPAAAGINSASAGVDIPPGLIEYRAVAAPDVAVPALAAADNNVDLSGADNVPVFLAAALTGLAVAPHIHSDTAVPAFQKTAPAAGKKPKKPAVAPAVQQDKAAAFWESAGLIRRGARPAAVQTWQYPKR